MCQKTSDTDTSIPPTDLPYSTGLRPTVLILEWALTPECQVPVIHSHICHHSYGCSQVHTSQLSPTGLQGPEPGHLDLILMLCEHWPLLFLKSMRSLCWYSLGRAIVNCLLHRRYQRCYFRPFPLLAIPSPFQSPSTKSPNTSRASLSAQLTLLPVPPLSNAFSSSAWGLGSFAVVCFTFDDSQIMNFSGPCFLFFSVFSFLTHTLFSPNIW